MDIDWGAGVGRGAIGKQRQYGDAEPRAGNKGRRPWEWVI